MMFKKYIERRVKNKWLAANVKYLPLLFLIYILLLILAIVSDFRSIQSIDWRDALSCLNIIIIPLCAVNGIYLLERSKILNDSPSQLLALKSLVVFIAIIIGTMFCELIEYGIYKHEPTMYSMSINGYKLSGIAAVLLGNIFLGMLIGIPSLIIQSRKQSIDLQLKQKELELNNLQKLKVKAQLETLQAKINPHFLYNSLNSIAALAKVNPDKVEQMTIALSRFFRYSTMTITSNYSKIDEEIEMINTYLEIEKIRFDDRLEYSITSTANSAYLIPRFLIQPLVENAIKHGLSKITTRAVLKVNVIEINNQIEISICDNGPDFPLDLLNGFGLQSTYEKLNLLFPNQYTVQFINGNEKRVMIILKKLIKDEPGL